MSDDRKNILIIDDDDVILQSIARQLRDENLRLYLESDPFAAMARIEAESFALVLCDIKMKPKNGLEVLQDIKALQPDLPVIIVSAFVDDETVEAAQKLGCAEFLFKPVRKRLLIAAIDRATRDSVDDGVNRGY